MKKIKFERGKTNIQLNQAWTLTKHLALIVVSALERLSLNFSFVVSRLVPPSFFENCSTPCTAHLCSPNLFRDWQTKLRWSAGKWCKKPSLVKKNESTSLNMRDKII